MANNNKLVVSASPHITSNGSVRMIMLGVVVALLPTLVAASIIFGARVLLLTAVTTAACVLFEFLYCLLMKKPNPVGDCSAIVTGLLLAFNLPPSFPLWMAIVGAFIAIVIVKQLFGGIGYNFANPALVARIVLQISFTGRMISYTYPQNFGGVDALASSTPLFVMQGSTLPLIDLLLGTHGGVLGETCAITLLLGGLFLIVSRIIRPTIPVVYLGGSFLLKLIIDLAGGAAFGTAAYSAFTYILAGGLLLGAFFMATDYTTCPYTTKGQIVYGLGLAVLTVVIREWSNTPEGVSYALLLMNLLVPYINQGLRQTPLGSKGRRKSLEKEAA